MKDLRISIHAPRVGRDTGISSNLHPGLYFNPRAPCGARRIASKVKPSCGNFNPRAPCGARRHPLSILPARHHHFNPRAPCGARLFGQQFGQLNDRLFQSTRPVWGATRTLPGRSPRKTRFQSTRPVWGATANLTILTRQICTKGTKEFLLGRKTHEERGKITQKLAYIHAFSAFFRCEGAGTFCALVLRTQ